MSIDRRKSRSYAVQMRWDALFGDLESQFAEADRLALDDEINDRARAELVNITLADRLRGSVGAALTVHFVSGDSARGELRAVGMDALVVAEGMRQMLIPYAAVSRYGGLSRFAVAESSPTRQRQGLAHALRRMAMDREEVSVLLGAGQEGTRLFGRIDRVGQDFFDLITETNAEERRTKPHAEPVSVPFSSLLAVTSRSAASL